MSRGPGRIERTVLTLLQDGQPMTVRELTAQVYGIAPGHETDAHSEHNGVRRALASLARKELVAPFVGRRWGDAAARPRKLRLQSTASRQVRGLDAYFTHPV